MCGIFGIVNKKNVSVGGEDIHKMHIAQLHRGPDNFGHYVRNNIFIGNNRLSIIDITNGNQPFYSKDKNIVVIQNGEIYNYKELRKELVDKGIHFDTNSDTEVILKLYELYDLSMLNKLNGMFSISILDLNRSELILVRDRFGQKPLFYYYDNNQFIFSSEIKSILELSISTAINFSALTSFLKYNFVSGAETIFDGIKTILPGNFLKLNLNNFKYYETKWWDQLAELNKYQNINSENNINDIIYDLVHDSISLRMRSDVKYGGFLSGGLDSSIVVSQMKKISNINFNSYTIGFENSKFDESEFSQSVANYFNLNHFCNTENTNILDNWNNTIFHSEQPYGDVSFIPLYLLSKNSANNDKVILTGDGADEIFGGYSKYRHFENNVNFADKFYETSKLFSSNEINKLLIKNTNNEDYLSGLINSDIILNSGYFECNKTKAMYLDTLFLLPFNNLIKPDRMGMAHSIELRCPFLDYRVISLALSIDSDKKINNNKSKIILREAFKADIPHNVYNRKKQKFIVPLNEENKTIKIFYNSIKNSNLLSVDILNESYIDDLYSNHIKGVSGNYRKLRALTALSKWYDNFSQYF